MAWIDKIDLASITAVSRVLIFFCCVMSVLVLGLSLGVDLLDVCL